LKELWKWSKPLIRKGNTQDFSNGLICLKGGDLTQELFESKLRPSMVAIEELFEEDYFKEKYLLHVNA
jgi:16S rRNA (guanine527-N7)-methyltransferase